MTICICQTKEVIQLNDQIFRVRISPQNAQLFDFKGGQYILLHMSDGQRVPLSIASPPHQKKFLELHIRLIAKHSLAEAMINLFKHSQVTEQSVQIEGAFGECFLKEGQKNLLIIAGGTGFSPMKSLIESAFEQNIQRRIELFLGAEEVSGLYQHQLIEQWQKRYRNFRYIPVISNEDKKWEGAIGFPHQIAIKQYKEQLLEQEIYIAGSENMVVAVYQSLLAEGVATRQIHSDILDIKRNNGEL